MQKKKTRTFMQERQLEFQPLGEALEQSTTSSEEQVGQQVLTRIDRTIEEQIRDQVLN
jgi:hypothetical protein